MEQSAENVTHFGVGRLKNRSFAINVQVDRCGFFASLTVGRRILWADFPARVTPPAMLKREAGR